MVKKSEALEAPVREIHSTGLDGVVGHRVPRRWLEPLIAAGRLPHALLLLGPRGVGKRTLAEALAVQHFCEQRTACGACAPCRAARRGNLLGLEWVAPPEGKSTISIQQIKDLGKLLSLGAPTERGRIVLLRGADRMTDDAQDALLKTLEEPPRGNVLVLTAERADRLLPTIRSRCQRLLLAPLCDEDLREVARRLGVRADLPLRLALGCPGQLQALAEPGTQTLRKGILWVLKGPRGPEDLARWTCVLFRDLPAKRELEVVRARARVLWNLLASQVRDLVVLSAVPGEPMLRNADFRGELAALAGRPEWQEPAEALRRLATARSWIEGSVDPAAALCAALRDPARDLAVLGESLHP